MGMAAIAVLACTLAGAWGASRLSRPAAPPLGFAARDWVLIADFENRTGDRSFDDVLEQALTRELTSSRHVNVVPRARVEDALTLMQQPPDAVLDARRAREVSLRDGNIRAVLSGRIARVGAAYVLTTEIVDPSDGRIHDVVEVDVADQRALLSAVREQAFRVRETLGEGLPALERSRQELARVTTPSLEALQLYSRAASLLEGEAWLTRDDAVSRYESADALLAQAIAVDPTFASAWLLRARAAAARVAERSTLCESRVHAAVKRGAPGLRRARALAGRAGLDPRSATSSKASPRVCVRTSGPVVAPICSGRRRPSRHLLQLVPDHYWALIELDPIYRRLRRIDDAERTALQAASVASELAPIRRGSGPGPPAAPGSWGPAARRDPRAGGRAAGTGPRDAAPSSEDLAYLRMWEARDAWLDADVTRLAALLERYERDPQMPLNARSGAYDHGVVRAWDGSSARTASSIAHSPQLIAAFRHNLVDVISGSLGRAASSAAGRAQELRVRPSDTPSCTSGPG